MKTVIRDSDGNFVTEVTIEDTDRVGMYTGGVRNIVVKSVQGFKFVAGLAPDFSDVQCGYANILDAVAPTLANLLIQAPPDAEFVIFDGLSVGSGTTEDIKQERLNWLSE